MGSSQLTSTPSPHQLLTQDARCSVSASAGPRCWCLVREALQEEETSHHSETANTHQGSGIGKKTKFNKKTGFLAFLKNKFGKIKRKFGRREAESVDHPEAKIRNKRQAFLEGNCGYACNPDGSCRVTWEGPPRSGGVEASCFPAEFGRGCIGSVQGCRDCSQLCGDGRCNPFIGGC